MHEQEIIDSIIAKLKLDNCEVKCISLIADEENLQRRLTRDVHKGIRKEDVIARSIARIPLYQKLDTVKVDTNNKTIAEIVAEIAQL
jgi:cytidylate kinase